MLTLKNDIAYEKKQKKQKITGSAPTPPVKTQSAQLTKPRI
jgi:hypothetical protein